MSTANAPARLGHRKTPVKGHAGLDVKLSNDKSSVHTAGGDPSHPRRITNDLSGVPLPLASQPISSSPLKLPIPRNLLLRRRSSFPPADAPQTSTNTPDSLAPEANLLDLLTVHTQQQKSSTPIKSSTAMPFEASSLWNAFTNLGGSDGKSAGREGRRQSEPSGKREGTGLRLPSPNRLAQYSTDLAWKTILGSVVEVEGIGEMQVSRVLQEIWARGGGDQVTAQNLWPSIIVSLSLPTEDHNVGSPVSTPPPHAAAALQTLYTLTLRHWEPAIFSGLLSSFGEAGIPLPFPDIAHPADSTPPQDAFGAGTPVRGLDLSQWMNLTPGADWSLLTGSGLTPRRGSLAPSVPGPSNLAFELSDYLRDKEDGGLSTSTRREDEQAKGLNELLAQMEEGREAAELLSHQTLHDPKGKKPETSYLPTPETDNDTPLEQTRRNSDLSQQSQQSQKHSSSLTPPESSNEPTPPVSSRQSTASLSNTTQATTPASSTSSGPPVKSTHARPHPTALTMPDSTFIPPPPMCMFFSPAFHDLQNGKVGIWKGDLNVQGRGGGRFSVLIVGEAITGHVWQSHTWPTTISYPPDPQPNQSCTATMMPVAHLAREGFTPAAMGMVLCNDANISQFVAMVQGFHAEGVAFHLATPGKLPIIFLPAKFSSEDPLQRLGIAFMTKPGIPLPAAPTTTASHAAPSEDLEGPRKKKRRQSAPAQTAVPTLAPLLKGQTSSNTHKRRQSTAVHTRSGGTRLDRILLEEEEKG